MLWTEVPRHVKPGRSPSDFPEPDLMRASDGSCHMSFSRGWNGYASDADARRARDLKYNELRARGIAARRDSITGQLRKYYGLMDPCGITSGPERIAEAKAKAKEINDADRR